MYGWNAPRGSHWVGLWYVLVAFSDHTHLPFADIRHLYSLRLRELFLFNPRFLLLTLYSKSCLEKILTIFSEH